METANSPALLVLGLPPSALVGIDLLSFTVTPRFCGIKDLPPGFHLAFAGTSTAFSERHGLWFHVSSPNDAGAHLSIARWNASVETLEAVSSSAEILKWRANLGSVWRDGLTPYRQTATKSATTHSPSFETNDWSALTSYITPELLSRIMDSADANKWRLTSASSARRDLEEIPGLSESDENSLQFDQELHFLPIDLKRTWKAGATGRERTEAAQDRTWALEDLAETRCQGRIEELIGEMQFCFLMVLTLNNFSCLEQWKRVLGLVLTCVKAIETRSAFFIKALAALSLQLRHCDDAEGGLIDLTDEGGTLLKSLLARFRKGVEGSKGPRVRAVVDELANLEEYLTTEHGWQFGGNFLRSGRLELEDGEEVAMETTAFDEDDETGEFAPQIVELTPDQARLLNLNSVQSLRKNIKETPLTDNEIYTVVEDSDDDEGDDDVHGHHTIGGHDDEEEEEDTRNIEEMDSRY